MQGFYKNLAFLNYIKECIILKMHYINIMWIVLWIC